MKAKPAMAAMMTLCLTACALPVQPVSKIDQDRAENSPLIAQSDAEAQAQKYMDSRPSWVNSQDWTRWYWPHVTLQCYPVQKAPSRDPSSTYDHEVLRWLDQLGCEVDYGTALDQYGKYLGHFYYTFNFEHGKLYSVYFHSTSNRNY